MPRTKAGTRGEIGYAWRGLQKWLSRCVRNLLLTRTRRSSENLIVAVVRLITPMRSEPGERFRPRGGDNQARGSGELEGEFHGIARTGHDDWLMGAGVVFEHLEGGARDVVDPCEVEDQTVRRGGTTEGSFKIPDRREA